MSNEILTSLHGRKLGLGHKGNLVNNKADGSSSGLEVVKTVTAAEVLALNATPVTLVAAPAAGLAHIVKRVTVYKPAGTAFAAVAAGDDLVVKYTNGSGAQASGVIECTGFLDQVTAETRVVGFPGATTTTAGDVEPVAAAALVLHMLGTEVTTGDSPLYVRVEYDTIKTSFTS